MKLYYTAGPGNSFAAFDEWQAGRRDLVHSHIGYSRQMMEVCARHGIEARITCTHEGGGPDRQGRGISVVRRGDPTHGRSGPGFLWAEWRKARRNIRDALEFGADLVVLAEDTVPGFYGPLHRRGIGMVQALHTRIAWNKTPSALQRLRRAGFRAGFRRGRMVVLSASDAISAEVEAMAGAGPGAGAVPIIEFLPSYYPDHYDALPLPVQGERLEILSLGRVEVIKGALDLVEIAARLRAAGIACHFHVCGIGDALAAMQTAVADRGLAPDFTFHGWCDRDALRAVMALCHLVIVPVQRAFPEGFNQVMVESVLSGRPVIASDICPAAGYIADAAVVVPADDLASYVTTIAELAGNRPRLEELARACGPAGRRFHHGQSSFAAAMEEVILAGREGRQIRPRRIPLAG